MFFSHPATFSSHLILAPHRSLFVNCQISVLKMTRAVTSVPRGLYVPSPIQWNPCLTGRISDWFPACTCPLVRVQAGYARQLQVKPLLICIGLNSLKKYFEAVKLLCVCGAGFLVGPLSSMLLNL